MKIALLHRVVLVAVLVCSCTARAAEPRSAIAMPDRYSAAASVAVLAAGGNAIDASITAAFVLAVTMPEAGNIGGGGFMVAYMDGAPFFLDFREKAPLAATADMFLDAEGNFVPRRSFVGPLGVGVPGTVLGLWEMHQRLGSLSWKRLLEPAIELAKDGFEVHSQLAMYAQDSLQEFGNDTNFHEYFGALRAGELLRQPELAQTLLRIAADPMDFYQGRIAGQLVAQVQGQGGLITRKDMESYTVVWREPLIASWRGHQLILPPPPSSGGVALIQLLSMHDVLAPWFNNVEHNSATYLHLLAELEKRVFADRGEYLGDPDFGQVPVAELTDPEYMRRRAMEVNREAISPAREVTPGLESTDTAHFSILDPRGNAVALTYTLNGDFGSGVVVRGAGFLLNNEMDDFSAKPGAPNAYGVVGADMNAIAPGKRMLSSMTPTILLREDEVRAVVGTRGGSTIFTSLLQVLLNVYDFDMSAQQAVSETRFHHQLPEATLIRYDGSRRPDVEVKKQLERMGYRVEPNSWGDMGDVQLILQDASGTQDAASDPRGRGEARVFPVLAAPTRGANLEYTP